MKKLFYILVMLMLAEVTWASTYSGIYVQGRLFDGTAPISSPIGNLTVRIVDSGTDSEKWGKTYAGWPVSNGIFSLYLSDDTGTFDAIDWSQEYDIKFTVNGTALPAQKLVSVPYTFMAKRIYGGPVEAATLTARRTGTGLLPQARMAYQSSVTDEAVAAWIGKDAVAKLGVEDKKISGTYYYGAFAEGRDYGIYAESTGQAVYAASSASIESLASALTTYGAPPGVASTGTRINGPLKIAKPFYVATITPFGGTSLSEMKPGAANVITITAGNFNFTVRNSLVKAGTTLIYFQVQSSGTNPRVWITDLVDGSFKLNRSNTTGDMKIGYLLVN